MTQLRAVSAAVLLAVVGIYNGLAGEFVPVQQVQIEFRAVSLALPASLPLVSKLRTPGTSESALKTLSEMITKGDAKIAAYSVVVAQSGHETHCSTEEWLPYPAEPLGLNGLSSALESARNSGASSEELAAFAAEMRQPWYVGWPEFGALIPSNFDTKSIGISLEIIPTISENGTDISIVLHASFSEVRGWHQFQSDPSPMGTVGLVKQPASDKFRAITSFTATIGATVLAASFVRDNPKRMLLFLIRTTSIAALP